MQSPSQTAHQHEQAGETHDGYECGRAWVALRAAYAAVTECLSAALGTQFGLGVNDFEVLLLLGSAAPRRLRLGELNQAAALSQPALSRLVDRLEAQGLVTRAETADDRRAVLIGITARGLETLQRAVPVHAACVRGGFIDRLSQEEQDALVAILARIQPAECREIAKSSRSKDVHADVD
jgi:DNA-binding MarR family transcriptional regulator